MDKKVYNKLVRDRIPEMIRQTGNCQTKILDEQSYILALKEKLIEESDEVRNAQSAEDLAEELADVLEVMEALKGILGISTEQVERARAEKNRERGRFDKRILLEYVEKN